VHPIKIGFSSLKKWQLYEIPFIGLKEGKHVFSYSLDEAFFEKFETNMPGPGEFNAMLEFDKKHDFFVLNFNLEGELTFPCDRCTEDFLLEINDNFRVVVKFEEDVEHRSGEEEDVVFVSRNDTHYNVAQLLYELSLLSIPMKKTHPVDSDGDTTCNSEILGRWMNKTTDEDQVDPRWEKLKKLQNK